MMIQEELEKEALDIELEKEAVIVDGPDMWKLILGLFDPIPHVSLFNIKEIEKDRFCTFVFDRPLHKYGSESEEVIIEEVKRVNDKDYFMIIGELYLRRSTKARLHFEAMYYPQRAGFGAGRIIKTWLESAR